MSSAPEAPAGSPLNERITLEHLRRWKRGGQKFAMLTAYDYPTAVAAQAAGVPTLLVGDSMGSVLLGHENTRAVPLELMIILAEAVRRGGPRTFLIGDIPFRAMQDGPDGVLSASRRFLDEAGCDAVKMETTDADLAIVERLTGAGLVTIAHLGLRPQSVASPDQYRAQAREPDEVRALAALAKQAVLAGAQLLLLEAVPDEASQAVLEAVDVPIIGCGAGPSCDGHVVVTHDLLGLALQRPPRFVPVMAHLGVEMRQAMARYVADIAAGHYPAPQHVYPMRRAGAVASGS